MLQNLRTTLTTVAFNFFKIWAPNFNAMDISNAFQDYSGTRVGRWAWWAGSFKA